jgi:DNA-directed RNA polymerase specialized sigma54-like protein
MITGFTEQTSFLTDEEKKLVPIIIKGLANKTSKDKAMYGAEICRIVSKKYTKLTEPRLRKITNFLRSEKILPVIATSKGYYISYDKEEIQKQIDSLTQRIDAIENAINGLKKWL